MSVNGYTYQQLMDGSGSVVVYDGETLQTATDRHRQTQSTLGSQYSPAPQYINGRAQDYDPSGIPYPDDSIPPAQRQQGPQLRIDRGTRQLVYDPTMQWDSLLGGYGGATAGVPRGTPPPGAQVDTYSSSGQGAEVMFNPAAGQGKWGYTPPANPTQGVLPPSVRPPANPAAQPVRDAMIRPYVSPPASQTPSGGTAQMPSWLQASPISNDIKTALMELINDARTQGLQGKTDLQGILAQFQKFLETSGTAADTAAKQRDQLINQLMSGIMPGLNGAIGGMNGAEGLSPEALATLRAQAIEGPERDYQGQAEQLRSILAGRGAAGGGDLPGSFGDIIRGYAPLMTARDTSRQGLLKDTVLADEQRKFETLGLNRNTGLQALGIGANLTGTLGNVYSPQPYLNAMTQALSGAAATAQSAANTGLSGTQLAGQLAGTRADLEPGSFKQALLGAALGTGASILEDWLIGGSEGNGGLLQGIDGEQAKNGIDVIGSAMKKAGVAIGGATKAAISGIGKGVSTAAKFLMSNPVTAVIGGALIAGTLWLKSQAHWEANTFVQNIQNPFIDKAVAPLVDSFNNLYSAGQLSAEDALSSIKGLDSLLLEFQNDARQFAMGGSDENKVANQGLETVNGAMAQYRRDMMTKLQTLLTTGAA